MKQPIFILMLLLFSFFINTYGQRGNTNGVAQQQVMQFERDVTRAFLAGDTTKINRYYANDYTGYYDHYSENKEMLLKDVTPLTGITIKDLEMKVRVYGTSAVVNGIWEMKMENQKPLYRQFMDMLIKQKDGWKLVATQQNTIPAWKVRALADSELVAVTAQGCETEPTLKSLSFDAPTYLRIKNNTLDSLTVYWINYSGQRDKSADQIRSIAVGKVLDQQTFVTHPFVVMGSKGKCYGIYTATPGASIAIIKD